MILLCVWDFVVSRRSLREEHIKSNRYLRKAGLTENYNWWNSDLIYSALPSPPKKTCNTDGIATAECRMWVSSSDVEECVPKTQLLVFKSSFPGTQAAHGAHILGEVFPKGVHCYGLNCVSPKFLCWSPTPDISYCNCIVEKFFQRIFKMKCCHQARSFSNMTCALIGRH